MGKAIVWTHQADAQLQEIFLEVLERSKSIETAQKVVLVLEASTHVLKQQPEIYPLDKYRQNNDGTIRAYEKYSYRISYQNHQDTIYILRVRHTSREPLEH